MKVKSESEVVSDSSRPHNCTLPGSSVHGISQARVMEWGAIASPRYADDTNLIAESEEELKSLWMKVKEESEKRWLKTQHPEN